MWMYDVRRSSFGLFSKYFCAHWKMHTLVCVPTIFGKIHPKAPKYSIRLQCCSKLAFGMPVFIHDLHSTDMSLRHFFSENFANESENWMDESRSANRTQSMRYTQNTHTEREERNKIEFKLGKRIISSRFLKSAHKWNSMSFSLCISLVFCNVLCAQPKANEKKCNISCH